MPLLDWVNKTQAVQAAAHVPYHLLRCEAAHGDPNAENLLIQGDNLLAPPAGSGASMAGPAAALPGNGANASRPCRGFAYRFRAGWNWSTQTIWSWAWGTGTS